MKQETKIQNRLLFFILVVLALEAIFFSVENSKLKEEEQLRQEHKEQLKITLENTPVLAQAVSVYNLSENISEDKKIYGKNDDISMPIASLAKILTVAVALNNYQKDEIISIPPEAIKQDGDFGLLAQEKWKVKDLARLTLISSANDGVYALATGEDFLQRVNEKARKIGLENSIFLNTTGLDLDLSQAGAFASAEDVNEMAFYAYRAYPEIFQATRVEEIELESESGFTHNFKNTNTIVSKIPNLLFSKTGFTEVAGGNLIVIFRNKRGEEIAITLLGSTFDGRFSDMETIVNILYTF